MALFQLCNSLSVFPEWSREHWMSMSDVELMEFIKEYLVLSDVTVASRFPQHNLFLMALFRPLIECVQAKGSSTLTEVTVCHIEYDTLVNRLYLCWKVDAALWQYSVPTYAQWKLLAEQSPGLSQQDQLSNGEIDIDYVCATPTMLLESNTVLGQRVMQFVNWLWFGQLTAHDPRLQSIYTIKTVFLVFATTHRTFVVNDPGFSRMLSGSVNNPYASLSSMPVGSNVYTNTHAQKSSGSRRKRSRDDVATQRHPRTMVDHIQNTTELSLFVPFFKSQTSAAGEAPRMKKKTLATPNRAFKFGLREPETYNYRQYVVHTHSFPSFYVLPTSGHYIEISPTHRTTKTFNKFADGAFYLTVLLTRQG